MPFQASVVALPDAWSLSTQTILKAALYFDEIYLESFFPVLDRTSMEGESLVFVARPWLSDDPDLAELRSANVIRPVPPSTPFIVTSFSTEELSSSLQQAISESLRDSSSLLVASTLSIFQAFQAFQASQAASAVTTTIRPPFSYSPKDPKNLDSPEFRFAICLHLLTVFRQLGVCASRAASPLLGGRPQASLLEALAREFPSVAKALGIQDSALLPKTSAVGMEVLRATLPDIRVRDPRGILALRDELKDELMAFRAELGRLSTEISSNPWDLEFQRELEVLVAREVQPAIARLNSRLAKPSRRILKHLVSDWQAIAAGAVVPLSVFLISNATLPWAILGGVSAGLGIAALKAKVEEWSAKSESAFAFLFEARKRLQKD